MDQAIEVPAPDAECRRRLFSKYGEGMNMRVKKMNTFIKRTEGMSATFIKELLRRSALFAAEQSEDSSNIVMTDAHIDAALRETLIAGGELTKRLLGAA